MPKKESRLRNPPKGKSLLDGHEMWHNGCGSFAGITRAEIIQHLKTCRSPGRTVHYHGLNPRSPGEPISGYTGTFTVNWKLLETKGD